MTIPEGGRHVEQSHKQTGARNRTHVVCWLGSLWGGGSGGGPSPSGQADPNLKWTFLLDEQDSNHLGSPAIGNDGTIYTSSNLALYAISDGGANGILKWKYNFGHRVNFPAIGTDGTIYVEGVVTNQGSFLYALNPNGTLKWTYPIGFSTCFSAISDEVTPAIAQDGTVYGGKDGLYAINPDGTLRWKFNPLAIGRTSAALSSSPIIAADGTIVFAICGSGDPSLLVGVNPDGTVRGQFAFEDGSFTISSPAFGSDGTIYIGAETSTGGDLSFVYAINPDGTKKWKYLIHGARPIRSSPAVGTDGTIYVGTKGSPRCNPLINGEMLALNPNGTLKWSYPIESTHCQGGVGFPSDVYSSPAIGNDGLIYFGESFLYALNPDGSLAWKSDGGRSVCNIGEGPAIDPNGTVFVSAFCVTGISGRSALFAAKSSSMGLANSPWPKFHRNNQNTGRIPATYATISMGTPYVTSTDIASINEAFSSTASAPWGFAHNGIDFPPAANNTPFQAVSSGTVESIDLMQNNVTSNWQVNVRIRFNATYATDHIFEPFTTSLADGQTQRANITLSVGQSVAQGDIIGTLLVVGNGAHVHFGLLQNNTAICPEAFFTAVAKTSILDLIHKNHPTWNMCY